MWYSQSAVDFDCAGEGSGDPVNEGLGFRASDDLTAVKWSSVDNC